MSKQVGEYNRGKYLIRQKTNREISKHNEWYDSASKKVYDNRLGKSQKETDKAYDKLGKELDRRIEESRRKQVGKEKDLADKLSKKYGIDVNVSMKEIQKGSAPYRIAMATVGDLLKKNNSVIYENGRPEKLPYGDVMTPDDYRKKRDYERRHPSNI